MFAYHSLLLRHYRSYTDFAVEFDAGVNIIVGPNGSGKTNLLEALYVLSAGGSFRVADKELLQHSHKWLRLEGTYGEQQRIATYRVDTPVPEKQFVIDGAKKARLTHQYKVPVVLFEPDHLRLLRESPSKRRDYLDVLLSKLQPDYTWIKHQFERVLAQRNAMLKRRMSLHQLEDQLFVWDIKFAELAEQVVARRSQLVGLLHAQASNVYSRIAGRSYDVKIAYNSTVVGAAYRDILLKQLHTNLTKDIERGFTTVGPHRDDIDITLNAAPAASTASRGEVRSLLLALKIIELQLLATQHNTPPLLLLDDVFSELDTSRRKALAELSKQYQTLITTTDADAIVGHFLHGYRVIATERLL